MGNQAAAPSMGYRFGRWVAGHKLLSVFIVWAVWFFLHPDDAPPAPQPAVAAAPAVATPDPRPSICGDGLADRVKSAKEAASKKEFRLAYELLDYCAGLMPKDGEAYKLRAKYEGESSKVTAAAAIAAEKAIKAAKKKEGVNLGMSAQDALDSSWGRPEHVNRTTTSSGTREQWVYNGNYLYFTNGVLTSIQN